MAALGYSLGCSGRQGATVLVLGTSEKERSWADVACDTPRLGLRVMGWRICRAKVGVVVGFGLSIRLTVRTTSFEAGPRRPPGVTNKGGWAMYRRRTSNGLPERGRSCGLPRALGSVRISGRSVVRVVWVAGLMGCRVRTVMLGAFGRVTTVRCGCVAGARGRSPREGHVLTCVAPERDDDQGLVFTASELPVPKNWGRGGGLG